MYRALVQCGTANIVRIHVIIWGCMPIDSTVHVLYPAIGSDSARCPDTNTRTLNNCYLEQNFRMGLVGDLSVVMAVLAVALPEGSEFVPPGWSGYLPILVSLRGEPTPQSSDFYERAEEEFAIPFSFLPLCPHDQRESSAIPTTQWRSSSAVVASEFLQSATDACIGFENRIDSTHWLFVICDLWAWNTDHMQQCACVSSL